MKTLLFVFIAIGSTLSSAAFACSPDALKTAVKALSIAEDRLAVGEGSKIEVALARTNLAMNKFCSQKISCKNLLEREENRLDYARNDFRRGLSTGSDLKEAAVRYSAAQELCR